MLDSFVVEIGQSFKSASLVWLSMCQFFFVDQESGLVLLSEFFIMVDLFFQRTGSLTLQTILSSSVLFQLDQFIFFGQNRAFGFALFETVGLSGVSQFVFQVVKRFSHPSFVFVMFLQRNVNVWSPRMMRFIFVVIVKPIVVVHRQIFWTQSRNLSTDNGQAEQRKQKFHLGVQD